ncbi:hypothetical protein JGS39_24155 [Streptomyces sp. P01-B04]|uniref:hypothetical protein n=1 Tax=Streptomyces poriferorum TaxID=2798799 RepID=UPI001C5FB490|nr:hypothetical protein [Streptomyces poriferorum]MBW5252056.1 hypothetical protein [Streptomyces poriferorum]MBW5260226.1 hypothetical protein [Streptomyces poriferorum]
MAINPYSARAEQAERFRITHLMQGLLILDTWHTCQTDRPWDFPTSVSALDAVRRAVDLPTASYWAEQLEQEGAPAPTDVEWADWVKQQRASLDDDYASAGAPTTSPAPEDPAFGAWIPGQPKGDQL